MFILKKITDLNSDSEEFKSEKQGVINNFYPIFTIATKKNITSVVFSITFVAKIIIIDNNGKEVKHTYGKKYCFNLKRRVFLNDKNIKAYFYSYKEGFCFEGKKFKKILIEHQL